jgi:hypothetical protein
MKSKARSSAVETPRRLSRLAVALMAAAGCSGEIGGRPPAGNPDPGPPGPEPPPAPAVGSAPAPTSVDSDPCNAGQKSFAPARMWQLTDAQYVNVVRDVFGVTLAGEDAKIISAGTAERYTNYSEGIAIDTQAAPNYQTAASRVADLSQPRMAVLLGSPTPTVEQVHAFITTKIARAWRRPVSPSEVASLLKIYTDAQADGPAAGFHLLLEAALQAGSFLYRSELGDDAATAQGPIQLTPYELAGALSFLFLETAPDDPLWARAQDGTLQDPAVLEAEVDRLMKLPAARANMTAKASYWLGVAGIANRSRSTRLYPEWNGAVKNALASSVQLFLKDVIGSGKLSDLFTSNRVYVNQQLGMLYGIPGATGTNLVPVEVPGTQRSAGILSQPGLIVAANKLSDRTDVVRRGLLVHDAFVCGAAIAPAPATAADEAKKMDGTERERAGLRAMKTQCSPCHSQFDPLGLTFARYDALGRYDETREAVLDSTTGRTSWQTSATPLDASAVLADDGRGDGVAGPVDGLGDLAGLLARATVRVGNCASRKLAEYSLGYNPEVENSCELKAVRETLVKTGSFPEFFRALALSPGFRTRNPLAAPQM